MNRSVKRFLCHFAYLLPAIVGLTLLIWACLPHVFFVNAGEAHETLSLFDLMGNTWEYGSTVLDGTSENAAPAAYFSYIMNAYVILSWIAIVLFGFNAIVTAVTALPTLWKSPTDPETNRAKLWLRFFCFNRGWIAFTLLLPIIPALFPCVLVYMQQDIFVADISAHYFGPTAWIVVCVLCVLQFGLFVGTKRLQAEEHMDMFRLYKAKK